MNKTAIQKNEEIMFQETISNVLMALAGEKELNKLDLVRIKGFLLDLQSLNQDVFEFCSSDEKDIHKLRCAVGLESPLQEDCNNWLSYFTPNS